MHYGEETYAHWLVKNEDSVDDIDEDEDDWE
jgi:hypothetical protein